MFERTYALHGDMEALSQALRSGLAEKYVSFAEVDETVFENERRVCRIETYQVCVLLPRYNYTVNVAFYCPDRGKDALTVKASVLAPCEEFLDWKGKHILKQIDRIVREWSGGAVDA